MAAKVWKLLPRKKEDLIDQLLYNRNIITQKDKELFFNPGLENYQKFLEIPGISKAHKLVERAIKSKELIIVYGDYDVDGLCASTIVYKALTCVGAKILPYIPHREKEGYGLSKIGLDHCKAQGATLVITVDNGIVALEQAKYAKKIGLDLIITDHHLPLDERPEADVIVHSTDMCGAAVAWCLMRDLVDKQSCKDLLQFAAIATVADMIPLVGLGRAFAAEGISILNSTTNLGLLALIRVSRLSIGNIGSYEVGHIISPRLNAIGRLEHAIDALRLLCTKDSKKARELADLLCQMNEKRRLLTEEAVTEARLKLAHDQKIQILHNKNWHPGLVGLVAARIAEEINQPAVAMAVGSAFSRGSARSVGSINIVEALRQNAHLLSDIGGHQGAAGFTIPNENIDKFIQRMQKIAKDFPDTAEKTLDIEAEVGIKDLTKKLEKSISQLEPFGLGNPKPLLATRNLKVSDIKLLSEGKHLKFKAGDIDAIAFGMGDLKEFVTEGQLVDLAYHLELNRFNGSEILQLKVKDVKIS